MDYETMPDREKLPTPLDADSWGAAVEMYERRYTFVAVAPRAHDDWLHDVASIMRGETSDPRSWRTIDPDSAEGEREDDPAFPFITPPEGGAGAKEWRSWLREVPRSSVERLLVLLATLALDVSRDPRFPERQVEMEECARVILARCPDGARFFTNTSGGGVPPDFYQRISSCSPISQYAWDLGLLWVSGEEVGLIWSFDPR
ncbi:hypothetical protein PV749_10680 [Streptomyces sp. ID03-2B]|uniref:hypothetical protein n=1 Tax=Streptomyces sp. ID03-2B TaxID=3028660 RepID=UPI0029B02630|nr:hypothetical protein [Streptomyces sp. ID03-2B]MDX3591588.1 hypothetical protein [Streptomyces sp. ID03-2B]